MNSPTSREGLQCTRLSTVGPPPRIWYWAGRFLRRPLPTRLRGSPTDRNEDASGKAKKRHMGEWVCRLVGTKQQCRKSQLKDCRHSSHLTGRQVQTASEVIGRKKWQKKISWLKSRSHCGTRRQRTQDRRQYTKAGCTQEGERRLVGKVVRTLDLWNTDEWHACFNQCILKTC